MRCRIVVSKEAQLYREQATNCRDLTRLADEIRRRLIDMGLECDDRARGAEIRFEKRQIEKTIRPDQATSEASEPLTLSIKDAARRLGLGRTTIYKLIGNGRLHTVKVGNRTLIRMESVRGLIDGQTE
jgi:excisionase family DNA binding protein